MVQNSVSSLVKPITLTLLTLQNVSLIIVMRFVRTRAGDMFFSSTAVVMSETAKLLACLCFITIETGSFSGLLNSLKRDILSDPYDCLLISVPSLIYVVQNNLLFLAVSNLDAATFQVTYQLKLLTTAVFFRLILKKFITRMQWFSLIILFVGVATVQLQPGSVSKPISKPATEQNHVVGFISVLVSCIMSGFAGIFFEKILKSSSKSLWLRNVQLASLGIVIGLMTVVARDGNQVYTKGFFFGYDWVVWTVIMLQSFGGLLVAAVVMYADNILKGFATSAAIIISAIVGIIAFDVYLSETFILGASLVVLATILYSIYVPAKMLQQPSDPEKVVTIKEDIS